MDTKIFKQPMAIIAIMGLIIMNTGCIEELKEKEEKAEMIDCGVVDMSKWKEYESSLDCFENAA